MNEDLGLKILSDIMAWEDEQARREFAWLRLISRLKYDGYRDFQAGMRFIESLATWLQQFEKPERPIAYAFIRDALVYVGPNEMNRLVEQLYPVAVREQIVGMVARERSIARYQVLANNEARADVERLRKQTLFMGLSDGAHIDGIRHSTVGQLSNEQFVLATQLDKQKWKDLVKDLRERVEDKIAQFRLVYLIDDFVGTGTSFHRWNAEKSKWSGKLQRFKESLDSAVELIGEHVCAPDWVLCIHHYIATDAGAKAMEDRVNGAREHLQTDGWAKEIRFTYGSRLPADLPIDKVQRYGDFIALTNKYYDPAVETEHTAVGGVPHIGLGYGGCALPIVLDHNTPNNSVALLWAETQGKERDGEKVAAMRPLFRRRQRHS